MQTTIGYSTMFAAPNFGNLTGDHRSGSIDQSKEYRNESLRSVAEKDSRTNSSGWRSDANWRPYAFPATSVALKPVEEVNRHSRSGSPFLPETPESRTTSLSALSSNDGHKSLSEQLARHVQLAAQRRNSKIADAKRLGGDLPLSENSVGGSLRGTASSSGVRPSVLNEYAFQQRLPSPLPTPKLGSGNQSLRETRARSSSVIPWSAWSASTRDSNMTYDDNAPNGRGGSIRRLSVQTTSGDSTTKFPLSSNLNRARFYPPGALNAPMTSSPLRKYPSTTSIHLISDSRGTSWNGLSQSDYRTQTKNRTTNSPSPPMVNHSNDLLKVSGAEKGNVASLVNNFERIDQNSDQQLHLSTSNQPNFEDSCHQLQTTTRASEKSPTISAYPYCSTSNLSKLRSSSMLSLDSPTSTSLLSSGTSSVSPSTLRNSYSRRDQCSSTSSVGPAAGQRYLTALSAANVGNVGGSVGRATGLAMTSNDGRQSRKLLSYGQFVSSLQSRQLDDSDVVDTPRTNAQITLTSPSGTNLSTRDNIDRYWLRGGADQRLQTGINLSNSNKSNHTESHSERQQLPLAMDHGNELWEFNIRIPDINANRATVATRTSENELTETVPGSQWKRAYNEPGDLKWSSRKSPDGKCASMIVDDDGQPLKSNSAISTSMWRHDGHEFESSRERHGANSTGPPTIWAGQYSAGGGPELPSLSSSSSVSSAASTSSTFRLRTGSLQSDSTGFDSGLGRSETCASSTVGEDLESSLATPAPSEDPKSLMSFRSESKLSTEKLVSPSIEQRDSNEAAKSEKIWMARRFSSNSVDNKETPCTTIPLVLKSKTQTVDPRLGKELPKCCDDRVISERTQSCIKDEDDAKPPTTISIRRFGWRRSLGDLSQLHGDYTDNQPKMYSFAILPPDTTDAPLTHDLSSIIGQASKDSNTNEARTTESIKMAPRSKELDDQTISGRRLVASAEFNFLGSNCRFASAADPVLSRDNRQRIGVVRNNRHNVDEGSENSTVKMMSTSGLGTTAEFDEGAGASQSVERLECHDDSMTTAKPINTTDTGIGVYERANGFKGRHVIVNLHKDSTGMFFSIAGGKQSLEGDKPIYIKRLFSGCSSANRQLQVGDVIRSVNDTDFDNMTRYEAWNYLKALPEGDYKMVILRQHSAD